MLWLCAAVAAFAHNPGLSSLRLEALGSDLTITLRLAALDADGDGRASPTELSEGKRLLERLGPTWFELSQAGQAVSLQNPEVKDDADRETLVLTARTKLAAAGTYRLELRHLSELPAGHREIVSIFQDGRKLKETILSAAEPATTFSLRPDASAAVDAARSDVSSESTWARTFLDFVRLGIEHILTGYDHMLYLAGLILACRRFRSIVPIITSFTVAHSITLGMATLGWAHAPSSIVEPLIAASIVYVGFQNLWLKDREPRRRWISAFVFGLIHGFGFADLLQEMGLGHDGGPILLPLFSFNFGVELGQLAVVSLIFPLVAWLRNRPARVQWIFQASSGVVALIGLYWFLQRVWV